MFSDMPHPYTGNTRTLLEWHVVKDLQVADNSTLSAVLQVHAVRRGSISTGIEWHILISEMPGAEDPAHDASLAVAVAEAVFKKLGIEPGEVPPYQVLSGERRLYGSDEGQAVRLTGHEASLIFGDMVFLVVADENFTDITKIDDAIAIARKLMPLYCASAQIPSVYARAEIASMVRMRKMLAEDADVPDAAGDTLPTGTEEPDTSLRASDPAAGLAVAFTPGEAKLTLRQLWLAVTLDDELDNAEIDAAVRIAHKLLPLCDKAAHPWAEKAVANMEKAKAWFALSEEEKAALDDDDEGGRWQVSIRREIGMDVIIRLKKGDEQEAIARALESHQWMSFNPATADYLRGNETACALDAQCPRCQNWDAADCVHDHGQCHACQALSQGDGLPKPEAVRQ